MSVTEVVARKDYTGNGSVDAFAYTWRITDKSHLEVLVDGVVQTVDTDYTVSGVDAAGGGSVTFTTPPAAGAVVTLLRTQPLSQLSDYVPNEAHPSDRIEKDLDKVVMALQQDRETLGRAIKFPKKSTLKDQDIPDLSGTNVLLGFDGSNALVLYSMSTGVITGVANPMSAPGDRLVGGTAGAPARLPAPLFIVTEPRFGAVGDGATDDRAAIQAALDAANAAGGGIVYVPHGTYRFSLASTTRAFEIYPKVVLCGAGRDATVLKLADAAGDYNALLAADPVSADASGFALRDLTLDQNETANTGDADTGTDDRRLAVSVQAGSGIRIARCRFTDFESINTVVLNGATVEDVAVVDCVFEPVAAAADHDHSTLYTDCDGAVIRGNTFRASAAGLNGVRTAIETHGGHQRVEGNAIVNYRHGMNITGISASHECDGIVVQGNTITGAQKGVLLWSNTTPDPSLRNCQVVDNTITLDYDAWESVAGTINGFKLDPARTAGTQNVRIAGNLVRLINVTTPTLADGDESAGIEWASTDQTVVDQNLVIAGNTVAGAVGAGIKLQAQVARCRIADNTLVNPGQGTAAFAEDFRAGILLSGTDMADLLVEDNLIVDDQGTSTIGYGIRNAAVTSLTNGRIRGNVLRVADGSAIAAYSETGTPSASAYVETQQGGTVLRTFAEADTTPSVANGRLFLAANASATTITTFDDPVAGQIITVVFTNANTSIAETDDIRLSAAFTSSGDDAITLIYTGTLWYEVGRSVN